MQGTFETSTEIWDIVLNLAVIASQMRLSHDDHKVCSLTLLLIHPLRLLLLARVTDYRELHILASTRREWANSGNPLAKLLRTRYPRTLKIVLVPSA